MANQGIHIIPRWLTLSQAMAYCGLGKNLLRKLADEGEVGRLDRWEYRPGTPRWDRESIDAYLSRGDSKSIALIKGLQL